MEAAEANLQTILQGDKQFLVPHYQRPYSWTDKHWGTLWDDLSDLVETPTAPPHFLGSLVTSPARSVPEGVVKRLLIDGQQRLTTLLVLLVAIRDYARENDMAKLADRIQDLVTNRHEEGFEYYKLLPTQDEQPNASDREAFVQLIAGDAPATKSGIGAAYRFFAGKLRRADAPKLDELYSAIAMRLTLVSIILGEKDNPHRIFESLNGKGHPLSQADLIRNFFFMRLDQRSHERIYRDLWRPMQQRIGEENLSDFVRHHLMRFVGPVLKTDIYSALKTRVDGTADISALIHLQELSRSSESYEIFIKPERASDPHLRERVERLDRLDLTVARPFLLAAFVDLAAGKLTVEMMCALIDTLENLIIRRFVCGIPTRGLDRVFAALYQQAVAAGGDIVNGVRSVLSTKSGVYPRDDVFREGLTSARLYGGGDRRERTKLILERLEVALGHREPVATASLTIEHVMPQTLSDEWKRELGADWEEIHEELLHTLPNLTLTNYNTELSNLSFLEKQRLFAKSHVELNRHFATLSSWNAQEMDRRGDVLAELALSIWPYFGRQGASTQASNRLDVTGTVPKLVRMRGKDIAVASWVDVAIETIQGIAEVGEEELNRVIQEMPKFVNRDATALRRTRLKKLTDTLYLDGNHSASSLHRLCVQAVQLAGLDGESWSVVYAAKSDTSEVARLPSEVGEAHH